MGLASLLPVLGFCLLFSRKLGVSHSAGMLFSVAAIVLALYLGGLADVLWWTALAVHLGGVSTLGYEAWRQTRQGARSGLPLPLVVLVVATALFYLVHRVSLYAYYDEFSHWGIYLREMLALDGYWDAATNSMHPRYPPAAPLWQYFFGMLRASGEGSAYLAQFVLLLTPLLVLWERLVWRQVLWALFIAALCLLALTNFGLGVASLYVDHVIATWFIGTILCFIRDEAGARRLLLYMLPLVVLALLKESSAAFALAAAGILGALVCYGYRSLGARPVKAVGRGAASAVALAVPALVCLMLWEWHLDRIGAPVDIEAVGGIVSGVAGEGDIPEAAQGAEITRRFIEVLVDQQLSNDGVSRQFNAFSYSILELFTDPFRLTTLWLFVLYGVWWLGLGSFILSGSRRWTFGIAAAGIGATGVAYLAALYMTYRFAAGDYGLVISSFTRYVHTIALPMLIVSFAPLLPAFGNAGPARFRYVAGRRIALPTVTAAAALAGLWYFETPYLRPVYEPNSILPIRHQIEPAATVIRQVAGRAPIWIYLPNDMENGFIGHLIQYLLAPTPATIERDPGFLALGAADVRKAWSEFGYVWLPAELEPADAARLEEIGGVDLAERFFVVEVDGAGRARLAPVASAGAERGS